MAQVKRLRVFAGPNGSGKSTLFEEFSKNYNAGYFINADLIEKQLAEKSLIDLTELKIKATQKDFDVFFEKEYSRSLIQKATSEGYTIDISIKENFIVSKSKNKHSYQASLVASFIRDMLFANNISFCFETVMSHSSKVAEIKEANTNGYQSYLYFVCTDNSEINVSRVSNRVEKGGHDVNPVKIKERYYKTLENLYPAIQLCYKTFLFDNSGQKLTLIAEIYRGKELILHVDSNEFPEWFNNYVLTNYI